MIVADKTFNADQHIYRSKFGRLPGATDIIKSEGLINTDWMSEDARWRGKVVHEGVRLINKGTLDENSVAEEMRGYLESYRLFLKTTGLIVLGFEEPIFDNGFACMPDLWGNLNSEDCIVELKTGPVPKWAAIQTALQSRALMAELGFKAKKRFGLRLMANGSLSKLIPFEDRGDDYAAMSMVSSFHWKLNNGYFKW